MPPHSNYVEWAENTPVVPSNDNLPTADDLVMLFLKSLNALVNGQIKTLVNSNVFKSASPALQNFVFNNWRGAYAIP